MILILCSVLALGSAATCWVAVDRGLTTVVRVSKPLFMMALIGLAVALGATASVGGRFVLVALACGLVGDVALLDDRPQAFLIGLAAFLLGHLAYLAAFVGWFTNLPLALLGFLLAGGLAATSGRRVYRAVARSEGQSLGWAVAAYIAVSVAMTTAAGGTGGLLVLLGALLFLLSDLVLALNRFVGPRARAATVVIVTYHLAQALLVLFTIDPPV